MNRRDLMTLMGGAAAWPVAARAQQSAIPVIGYLALGGPSSAATSLISATFAKGLNEAGFVEGRNVAIEYRFAFDQAERLPELAADLVRGRVNVIAAPGSNAAAFAAKAATSTIPIVFSIGGDPVKLGLVANLNRPGGNITGASFLATETAAKMVETLHELVPNTSIIAALDNPGNPTGEADTNEAQKAARILGLELRVFEAATANDIATAFAALVRQRAGALMIEGDPLFANHLQELVVLTAAHAMPAIFQQRIFPDAGGLLSYGADLRDAARINGVYVGRILKGDKPADLPVQQSSRVELIINMTTAKALGITVPNTLLGRADEVIE
jgi:putative ABC transport system substrate-binding protein